MSHFQLTVHRMKIERRIQKSLSSAAFTAHYLVNKRYKIIMLTYQANLKYYTRQTYLASFSDRLLTCTVLPGMSIRGVQPATDFHRLTFIDGLPLIDRAYRSRRPRRRARDVKWVGLGLEAASSTGGERDAC